MKKLTCILLVIATFVLTGCHEHIWTEATCTQPMTCEECGKTEGEILEHIWSDATCTEPKTCTKCGKTEGESNGHYWIHATCTEPNVCEICKETDGEPLGHTWLDATCTSPQICENCGEINGNILSHNYSSGYCKKCGTKDPDFVNLNEFGFNNNYGMNIWLDISGYDFKNDMVIVTLDRNALSFRVFYDNYFWEGGLDIDSDFSSAVSSENFFKYSNGAVVYQTTSNETIVYKGDVGTDTIIERVVDSNNSQLILKLSHHGWDDDENWYVPTELLDFSTIELYELREDNPEYSKYSIKFK